MEEQTVETTQEEISLDTWTNSITDNAFVSYWLKIWLGVVVFLILAILSKVATRIIRRNIRKHLEETNPTWAAKIAKLLASIAFWILMLFAIFICFEIMWVNIWLLISWVSLWVWLAFKEVLWNMFAGIMILYTKEFKMWDIIEIQTWDGYFWRIEEITIRYTVIRTLDLRQVIIPNMTMISEPIKTFSSEDLVKLNTIVWISYKSDVTKAIEVLKDTINSFDFVKSKENTNVFVLEFGKSTINLKCVFCFDPKCGIIWEVAIWQINERVPLAFEENGIEFSYDHIVLNFEDTNKETNEKVKQLFANEEKRDLSWELQDSANTNNISDSKEQSDEKTVLSEQDHQERGKQVTPEEYEEELEQENMEIKKNNEARLQETEQVPENSLDKDIDGEDSIENSTEGVASSFYNKN